MADPAFSLHTVISDESTFAEHVTVENAAGQQFPCPVVADRNDRGPKRTHLLPV
jgi:hypothetical protein